MQSYHFCRELAPGSDISCKTLRANQLQAERKSRERQMAAELNGGVPLGSGNKDLMARLAPLVVRSYSEVGKLMQLSPQAVRMTEIKALAKVRAALLPFRNARSGAEKITQVCNPIPSLED